MAIGADFDVEAVAFDSRARLKIVAAGAVHRYGMIVGMNTGFHEAPFCRVRSARLAKFRVRKLHPRRRVATAASLGREANKNYTGSWLYFQMWAKCGETLTDRIAIRRLSAHMEFKAELGYVLGPRTCGRALQIGIEK